MQANNFLWRIAGLAAGCIMLLEACSRGPLPVTPLKTTNLPAVHFTIRADRDTMLRTPAGARIRIAAGTLQPDSGNSAGIVIREAYNLGQMLRGGLATISSSDILSSGGMISIEPDAGTKRVLAKPVRISIPASERRAGMQLWSGGPDSSRKVEWTDPQPLNNDSAAFRSGRELFNLNCLSCHDPKKDATGPALGHVLQTRDWEWVKAFTRNPSKMLADGDILAHSLYCRYGTVMTAFPSLSDSELHAILTYAEMKAGPSTVQQPDVRASIDSCKAYLKKGGFSLGAQPSLSQASMDDAPLPAGTSRPQDGVIPEDDLSGAYEISVRSFGWYSIDLQVKDLDGFENSNLIASFTGARQDGISVYLLLPDDNILLEGGPSTSGAGTYAFYRNDGTVPLRQGVPGIVAGVKDSAGQWFFSMKEFKTTRDQTISLELRPVSKDSLNAMLDRLVGNKNAAETARKRESQLANSGVPADALRPKNITCGCR